jgi:hypothetical protein
VRGPASDPGAPTARTDVSQGPGQSPGWKTTTLLKPSVELVPSRLGLLSTWLPRIAVALIFVSVGSAKFQDPMWVRLFGEIGLGQWFRYVLGRG